MNIDGLGMSSLVNFTSVLGVPASGDINANVTTFNFDAFAAHYSSLDDTPYLAASWALIDSIDFVNQDLKMATIVQYLQTQNLWQPMINNLNTNLP